jgi:hypothetical protein
LCIYSLGYPSQISQEFHKGDKVNWQSHGPSLWADRSDVMADDDNATWQEFRDTVK